MTGHVTGTAAAAAVVKKTFLHGCVVTSHYWSLVTIGQGRTPQGRGEEWVRLGTPDHNRSHDHNTALSLV